MGKKYLTSDFDYNLPKSFIANTPAKPRDTSRLLVYDTKNDQIHHKYFYEIVNLLNNRDLIVRNKSKVISARIIFKINEHEKEIFLLKQLDRSKFKVLVKPGKTFKKGYQAAIVKGLDFLVEDVLDDGSRIIKFINKTEDSLNNVLEDIGQIPLPPYINNKSLDFTHYQTVYAKEKGSVAAPTAGLHFTESLIKKLKDKGIKIEDIILHIGRGTFLPVSTNLIEEHEMHSEKLILDKKTAKDLNKFKKEEKKFVALGTTTVRTLESCYDKTKGFIPSEEDTDIFIYPGKYKWKVVDKLITNFHLPKSTLIMLVASFLEYKGVKDPVKKILSLYETAKKEGYRFYSLGDSMFIF